MVSPRGSLKRPRTTSLTSARSLSPLTPPPASPPPTSMPLTIASPSRSRGAEAHTAKKLKLLTTYADSSPFPNYPHPTPDECAAVHALLAPLHSPAKPEAGPSIKKNSAETCGRTPDILDALIGTILSQNTTSKNSSRAKAALDAAFPTPEDIVASSQADLADVIRSGGLANKKAAVIQSVLKAIKEKHGSYSLQHLAASGTGDDAKTDAAAMEELVSFPGVGPKTAACVLMFAAARPVFAVDTHVFRLSRMLGWVPRSVKDGEREIVQAHLEVRVPSAQKEGLHVGMVRHGRTCPECKAGAAMKIKGSTCVLREWMRTRGDLEFRALDKMEDLKQEDDDSASKPTPSEPRRDLKIKDEAVKEEALLS